MIDESVAKHFKSDRVILELGCGETKAAGRIGIDRLPLNGVDIVWDLNEPMPFIADNSVDEIHTKSVLEHVDNLEGLMKEIWRILKPTGRKIGFVPHFSNPYYYSDYTHSRFFGLYSFAYFGKKSRFRRRVPNFYQTIDFDTEECRMVFSSPFFGRNLFKRAVGRLVNCSTWTQELYEENFCYIVPCYGIRFRLRPIK